jgi:splicing factor 1
MNLNPATRQSGLLRRKRTNKIRIPIEEHPQYNFIGLIIGPRGKTQKELENKTGCKIAIRGRGFVKEGARGRRDGKVMKSDDEPLHVVISGDNQRSVDAATDMIEQMLVVIDDEKNVPKQISFANWPC